MAELGREDWTEDAEEPAPLMPREFVPDGPVGRGSGADARRPAWDTPPPANGEIDFPIPPSMRRQAAERPAWNTPPPADGEIDFPIPPSMRNRLGDRPAWDTPAPESGEIDFPIPPSMRNRMSEPSTDTPASKSEEGGFSWPASMPRVESSRPAWDTPPPAGGEIDYPIPPSMRRAGQDRPAWETPPPADGSIDFTWPPSLRRDDAERPAWETPAAPDEELDFPWPPSMPRPGAARPSEQAWPPLASSEDEQPGWGSGGWSLAESDDDETSAERPWLSASRLGAEDGEEAAVGGLDFPWPPSMPRPESGSASSFEWSALASRPSERIGDDEAAGGQKAALSADVPEPPRRSEAAEEMLSRFSIPARGEELISRPIAPLPGQDPEERASEVALPPVTAQVRVEVPTASAFAAGADPLIDAINRSKNGAAPLPITLITGVPPYPGVMGPLVTHIASRLRARRPWGWWDRLAAGHTMLANMLDALEREDLDGAVRYLNALLLDDALAEVEGALLVPLWNVDPEDQRGWAAFRALSGLVSLAIKNRRVVLHLIATSRAGHNRAAERDFDLVVPVEQLAAGAYDTETRQALKAIADGKEPPRERDLRLHLPIVQIQRRHDELILGVRAPEIEAKKGLGGLFKGVSKQKEEEQFAAFGRQAMTTAFRWDPFLQYVHLTLLREDRGVRRSVLEIEGARADYPDAGSEAA